MTHFGTAEDWRSLAASEPNRAAFAVARDHAAAQHPELSKPLPEHERTPVLRRMLNRASFFLEPHEIEGTSAEPEHGTSALDLAHHAARFMTDRRQQREEEQPRQPWDHEPRPSDKDPDERRHGKDFTWHYALALDGAGHRDAADAVRGHYRKAQVQVAHHRHAQGLSRDYPGSGLSPDMPPDQGHLPPMITSQREGLASSEDRDYSRRMLDVASHPEPGLRLWRGERRSAGEDIPGASSVGMHWSAKPEAVITGHDRTGDTRPVVWQARLEHPESQAIPRSHPVWRGVHESMPSEAEVRLRPGSSVHVEGAWVGEPGSGSVHPLHPQNNPPGWKWHPVGRHVPVKYRGHGATDYSDVGFPREAAKDLTLYHRTSRENAESIRDSGSFEPGEGDDHEEGDTDAYFTDRKRGGTADDFGSSVVTVQVPRRYAREVVDYSETGGPDERWYGVPHDRIERHHIKGIEHDALMNNFGSSNGDRYVTCDQGHTHWGAYGAAGLLIRHKDPDDGKTRYLLQKRAPHVDHGNTWSVPGGARGSNETPRGAAMRETREEIGSLPADLTHHHTVEDSHGGWSYHTVIMDSPSRFTPRGNGATEHETAGTAWLTPKEIEGLPLHPGFAKTWDKVRRSRVDKTAASGYDLSPGSGMISLDIPPGVIERHPGGVDDHHITICYLGKGLDDEAYSKACHRAREAAAAIPGPFGASLHGTGTFPPSDSSDGKVPAYLNVHALVPYMTDLRRQLEDLSASEHKDWAPHVTLAYLDPGEPLPESRRPVGVRFTHLSVHRGDDVARFPLGG
jgi:YD repeat-containing protein